MISPSGGSVPGLRNGTVNPTATSMNWSGYAVTSSRAGAFGSVSAGWTEPKANCSGVSGLRFSSFWVGLDGANNGTVEQLGTEADCGSGQTPGYSAWWETYPSPSVKILRKVAPGDRMFASVTFRGAGRFALFIQDITRRWSRTIIANVSVATRTSAEVIAEAPALVIGRHTVIQSLTDFGTVRWTGSRVNGTLLKNIGRRIRITMMEVNGPLVRATTSPVGAADAFTNTWVRAS